MGELPPGTPIFSTLFNYRHDPNKLSVSTEIELLPGVKMLQAEERTNYPLILSVDDQVSDFSITVQAAVQIGSTRVCGYMLTALEGLTSALERNPETDLQTLHILSSRERSTLLTQWSGKPFGGASETLLEKFERQASRVPDAAALVSGTQALSYSELRARADRLAERLIERGVGAESIVALWADRSVAMVIGVLAIWKAGGAYLALDPATPRQRLELMLKDAQPVLMLTHATSPKLEVSSSIAQLSIDAPAATATSHAPKSSTSAASRLRRSQVDRAAYVIYTSGSTGTPKAVVVTHAGLSALAAAQVERLNVSERSRVLQFGSLSFDASVWETLMAFSNGATLVLAPADALSGDALQTLLIQERISHVLLPPAVLATLSKSPALRLECLIVGGESCPAALVARWSPGLRMINAYRPDREHRRRDTQRSDGAGYRSLDRLTDSGHACVRAGCHTRTGAGRRNRRAVHRWRGSRAWLPEAARTDSRALRGGSV
ncbi:MAG: AMP-binding protein [Gammaproteobacteria bacterium]